MATFGVFDWIDRNRELSIEQLYQDRLGLLRQADTLGYDIYHLAEHHGTPLGLAPSPNLFLSAATQVTRRIRLCPLVNVLPLRHPLRLLEEFAMLDQLSGGRLEIGVGKGSTPYELTQSGVDLEQAPKLFGESLEVIRRGLEGPRLDWSGEHYDAISIEQAVTTQQRPHPPMWYPTTNPDSVPRLAAEGFNTIFSFGFISPPVEEIMEKREEYFARIAELATPPVAGAGAEEPRFGVLRHVHIADTDEQALEQAIPALESHYEGFIKLWKDHGNTRIPWSRDFRELNEQGLVIIGSPENVATRVHGLLDDTGANHMACAFAFGTLPTAAAGRSMELFAKHVMTAG
ncbi:MAG: LLM class flavin-dependent oxidoreductase [Nitriliruptorales bacterium]|nr:LLM class flavin-dependent oxidoreductase [Nitriliruptorales bacterium]